MLKYFATAISALSSVTSLIADYAGSRVYCAASGLIALTSYAIFAVCAAKATKELSRP